jgi:hypothetical protein
MESGRDPRGGWLCRRADVARVLRIVAQLLLIEGSILLIVLVRRRGRNGEPGVRRSGTFRRLLRCSSGRGRTAGRSSGWERIVTSVVALAAGGAVVAMGAYDVARAASGCGGADGLEIGARVMVLASSMQQAGFLWWLRKVSVKRNT